MQSKIFEEIKSGLDVMFEPGQTFEVRALGGNKTASGFFRDSNKAAEYIERIDNTGRYTGIYVTINSVNPDLYYRRMDRIDVVWGKGESTSNDDIIKRRWLLVDIDPERPSGISASDAQKQLAIDLIPSVRQYLTIMGFPEPIVADSGNGMHLLYRIDLEPKSDLVKTLLTTLSKRFDVKNADASVKIDTSVSNPGRISKIYGTMVRKGDNSQEKPHRRSRLLSVPNNIEVVPIEILERVAYADGNAKLTDVKKTDFKPVSEYLDEWGLGYNGPELKGKELTYTLDDCPFSPDHEDGAYICQNEDTGAIVAKCHHDRCGGGKVNHWKDLRERYDPYYFNPDNIEPIFIPGTEKARVLDAAKYNIVEALPDAEESIQKDYLKLDVRLSRDNFIVKYMNYWQTRTDAYPEYHHAAALVLLSIIADRILVYKLSAAMIYTNIWGMCLGKSSISRKSTAVNKTRHILESGDWLKPYHHFPGMFSSEGLIEEMSTEPKGYMVLDECAQLLASINLKKYLSDLRDVLCKVYDCEGTRRKLKTAKGKVSEFKVENPYASFLWATTHENFMGAATGADITSGWLIRFLYYYPEYPKDTMGIHDATGDEDDKLGDIGRLFWEMASEVKQYDEIRCTLTPFGFEYFNTWMATTEAELLDSGVHGSVFQRYAMYSLKLAALYYIGEPGSIASLPKTDKKIRIIIPDAFLIEAVRQINEYFLPVSRGVIGDVSDATAGNIQNKIIMALRGAPGRTLTKSQLIRILKTDVKEINSALDTLEEGEVIIRFQEKSDGAKKKTYYIKYINGA